MPDMCYICGVNFAEIDLMCRACTEEMNLNDLKVLELEKKDIHFIALTGKSKEMVSVNVTYMEKAITHIHGYQ